MHPLHEHRPLDENDLRALLALALDPTESIARRAQAELIAAGQAVLPLLEELADEAPDLAGYLYRRIWAHTLDEEWKRLARLPNVEDGAILVSRWADPDIDPLHLKEQLDALAEPLVGHTPPPVSQSAMLTGAYLLSDWLASQHGFRGDTDEYYHPRNAFLHETLARRRGLPLTLCVVYLSVARRLNAPLVPVALPGHFVVRYGPPEYDIFIDPFRQGRVLDTEALRRWMAAQGMPAHIQAIQEVDDLAMLARMLRNLIALYERIHHAEHRADAERYLHILAGHTNREDL
nr:transglutaminase-like domain-containing protein [Ardenticatena sp.]